MRIGMIGLGRMGANMVRRLTEGGHQCVAYDRSAQARQSVVAYGAQAVGSPEELVRALAPPRAVWIMVPAAIVDPVIAQLQPQLAAGDVLIDGGNSNYHDDIRRADQLKAAGISYLDVGTSGGVLGFEDGYCLMIGGEQAAGKLVEPGLATLAPGGKMPGGAAGRAAGADAAALGYLHCRPSGAGHFVKMVHNGIEYGLMAAYAEGLNVLAHADAGKTQRENDAETTPLRSPEHYQYDFNLADVTEVWRRGSVVASWLLDLTAISLLEQPQLERYSGRVSDSGEGRWTIVAGIESGAPCPVLTDALYERFTSRGESDFASKLLSAMRFQFGGHVEKKQ